VLGIVKDEGWKGGMAEKWKSGKVERWNGAKVVRWLTANRELLSFNFQIFFVNLQPISKQIAF
jgi:hypothetical protein